MKTAKNQIRKLIPLAISFALSCAILAIPSDAREWDLGGQRGVVEANLVDFNGQEIALETKRGRILVVDIRKLNETDRAYVRDIVETQSTFRQQQLQEQQLNQQRLEALSQYFDVWAVELIAPNGDRMVRQYIARDNVHAVRLASLEFPYARTGYSKKIRRRNFFW